MVLVVEPGSIPHRPVSLALQVDPKEEELVD